MASHTLSTSESDLRSPISTTVRKGIGLDWLRPITLILLDSSLLLLAWQIVQRYHPFQSSLESLTNNPCALLPAIFTIHLGLMGIQGLYQYGENRRNYQSLIKTLTWSHILAFSYSFFCPLGRSVPLLTFISAWLLSVSLTCTGRLTLDSLIYQLRRRGAIRTPVYVIGPINGTQAAMKLLKQVNRYKVMGFLEAVEFDRRDIEHFTIWLRQSGITEVFACSWDSFETRMFFYWSLRNAGITLNILPIGLQEPLNLQQGKTLRLKNGTPFVRLTPPIIAGVDFWIKRGFDFLVSAVVLVLASPVYLLLALLIKLDSEGPIFYKQARVGLHGKEFQVWKFRTMVTNADKLQKELEAYNEMQDGVMFKMKNDPRITSIGRFLRRYSLDELPQLFNVVLGQMSLVGPRPLPLRDVNNLCDHHLIRHQVLPGITGFWQVSGRSDITNFDEVLRLDIFYMENWSLWLDMKLLLKTVVVLLQKKGAY